MSKVMDLKELNRHFKLSERTIKTRKSLLLISTIILLVYVLGVSSSNELRLFGINFSTANAHYLQVVIRTILSYFLISFMYHGISELLYYLEVLNQKKTKSTPNYVAEFNSLKRAILDNEIKKKHLESKDPDNYDIYQIQSIRSCEFEITYLNEKVRLNKGIRFINSLSNYFLVKFILISLEIVLPITLGIIAFILAPKHLP